MTLMSTWTERDKPVLRWLREQGSSFLPEPWNLRLGLRDWVEPPEEVPGLTSQQMDQALVRLLEHNLIDGRRQEAIGFASWSGLGRNAPGKQVVGLLARLTAQGMQVLGEWPDLDQLTSAVGMKMLLNELAKSAADSEDQGALRRMVGIIGEVGEGIALSTLNTAAGDLGGELGDQ
jgi:hypothetical protein